MGGVYRVFLFVENSTTNTIERERERESSSGTPSLTASIIRWFQGGNKKGGHGITNTYFFSHSIRVSRSGKVETVSISDGGSSSPPNWCFFGWLLALTQLLLHGALGLVLFWVIYYLDGFGWRDNPKLLFNYHPVLMVGGFVYLSGNGKLYTHTHKNLNTCVVQMGEGFQDWQNNNGPPSCFKIKTITWTFVAQTSGQQSSS